MSKNNRVQQKGTLRRFFAIDLAKRESQLCVTDADGDVLEERRFSTTPAKLEEIAAQLTKHDTVCFEMTTNSFAIARLFKELSPAKVLVSNPMKTKLIASARVKTDKIDARVCWLNSPAWAFCPMSGCRMRLPSRSAVSSHAEPTLFADERPSRTTSIRYFTATLSNTSARKCSHPNRLSRASISHGFRHWSVCLSMTIETRSPVSTRASTIPRRSSPLLSVPTKSCSTTWICS